MDVAAPDLEAIWDSVVGFLSGLFELAQELVIVLGALGAMIVFALTQRAAARDRQRQEYAKALQAVLKWVEMPYRIHRQAGTDEASKAHLVEVMHQLQEELAFHDAWLSVEAPRVAIAYSSLVSRVKSGTAGHLQRAWVEDHYSESPMNLGNRYPVEYERERTAFVNEVRDHLRWFGIWEKTMGWRRRKVGS